MKYETARQLVIAEGCGPDGIVIGVRTGDIPDSTRMAALLIALETVFESLRKAGEIDRELASALFALSFHIQGDIDGRISRGIATRSGFLDDEMVRMFLLIESISEDETIFE